MSDFQQEPLPPLGLAFDVTIVDAEVVFMSPTALAFAMTMEAATVTAERLLFVAPAE